MGEGSPQAIEGNVARGENCVEGIIDWGAGNAGKTVLVKAHTPTSVIFALKDSNDKIAQDSEREVALDK